MRLSPGRVARLGIDDRQGAANAILCAIEKVQPAFLRSLADDVLPPYAASMQKPPAPDDLDERRAWIAERKQASAAYRAAFREWAAGWRIAEPSDNALLATAEWLLSAWRRLPQHAGTTRVLPGSAFPASLPPTVDLQPPTFEPWIETEAEADARWQRYKAQVCARYAAEGWDEAPTKRQPEHFEWLALRVACSWPWTRIARQCLADTGLVNTVKSGCQTAASLVGLRLPKGTPGRPTLRAVENPPN